MKSEPKGGAGRRLNLPQVPKAVEYVAVFYVFVALGILLLLDMAAVILLSLLCVFLYYAARNPEWTAANLGRLLSIPRYGRANQNRVLKMLADNLLWIYVVLLSIRLYLSGLVLLPDHVIFYGLVGALLVGRGKSFVMDWAPLFILFFAYEAMRGIAPTLGAQVHFTEPILWDQAIFGFLPNVALQHAFYLQGVVHWYDIAAMGLYSVHMGVPLLFAFMIWISDRQNFLKYSGALMLTTYLALVTFMLYPMAPPWLAAEQGLIGVHKVLFESASVMDFKIFPTLYEFVNSNPVAAMPSLHAAYPVLMIVFAARIWRAKGALLVLAYGAGMWLGLIYLGEHYFIDLLAGSAYAFAGLLVTDGVSGRFPPTAGPPPERKESNLNKPPIKSTRRC